MKMEQQLSRYENCAIGHEAPEIVGKDTLGNELKLSDLRGNYVLVDFWNSSKSALEHCREEVYTQGAWDYADCQAEQLAEMLDTWANFLGQRLALCRGENGVMPTYSDTV